MQGRATAPGAGTVLNALATGRGAAFALDVETTASVALDPAADSIDGTIAGHSSEDTALIERCVAAALAAHGDAAPALPEGVTPESVGGTVRTESDVPPAAGLKSSSAAANATVLATLSALGVADEVARVDACRLGVAAARDAGVTVTGAFDDASASMLGGVTVTDNDDDGLLASDPPGALLDGADGASGRDPGGGADRSAGVAGDDGSDVPDAAAPGPAAVVWTPPERAYSADADAERCARIAPIAETVASLALSGQYAEAMTVNGLAFSAALGFDPEPAIEALPAAAGVSLSGTGPSVVAVGEPGTLGAVADRWRERPGTVRETTVRDRGAEIDD